MAGQQESADRARGTGDADRTDDPDRATEGTPDERIARAVLDLLRTRGPGAVTIEAVGLRTGLARTTIYRRHRDRAAMLAAAMSPITRPEPPAPDAAADELLRWVAEQSLASVDEGIGLGGMAALVTDAEPWFSGTMRALLAEHRSALTRALEAGIAAGTVRADLDVPTFLDTVVGAVFAERARSGAVADGWADRVASTLLPALTPA